MYATLKKLWKQPQVLRLGLGYKKPKSAGPMANQNSWKAFNRRRIFAQARYAAY